jgi:hypothetical protein
MAENDKKGDNIKGDMDIEYKDIDAPNALIVTQGQSGGTNTVYNTEPPPPKINLRNWSVRNQIVSELQMNPVQTVQLPSPEIPNTTLYHNQFIVEYNSEFACNEIGFRIKRTDVKHGTVSKSGMLMWKIAGTREGWFVYVFQRPENGLYTLDIYTENTIQDILSEFDYLK